MTDTTVDAHMGGSARPVQVRHRMFWRLFGTFAVLWLAAVGLLGVLVVRRVDAYDRARTEEVLRSRAYLVREIVRGRGADEAPSLQGRVEALRQETGTRISLIARDGTVLADSDRDPRRHAVENHLDRPEVTAAAREGAGVTRRRRSSTVGEDMTYLALRTDDPAGATAYVRVALPLRDVEPQLAELEGIVVAAAAGFGAVGAVLAFWLARRFRRPLLELTAVAQRIAGGDYGRKVYAGRADDEVGTLAHAFNHMSERLAAQFAQLEEDRQQLRTILSGMVEGVVALDGERRILFANERAAQLLGFRVRRATGRKVWEVVRHRPLQDVVEKAMRGDEPVREELRWDGAAVQHLTVHVARWQGSPARGAVLVVHDTTELRRLERVRRDFVANVSHELKTPLSVIKACVETLLDGAADDPRPRGQFLEQIAAQADRLHALILDLLSLARIESGAEVLDFRAVPLGPVVQACVERHRARAEARKQTLEAVPPPADEGVKGRQGGGVNESASAVPPSPPPPPDLLAAWADEEAVDHILDNLVDNALKYTPEGGRIRVSWRAEEGEVCLEVADTGIGIPERDLPRVFERFYRVDRARSRELGGTGLGLSIVKHLAQALRGSVQAASRPGQGTTFTVRLPRAAAG